IFEPGLEDLVKRGLAAKRLQFSTRAAEAVASAEVVWIAHDTPVDADDRADVDSVVRQVERLFEHFAPGILVLISAQLPVGTTHALEETYRKRFPGKPASFGYSPENLRLGKAISVFSNPDRVVV